MILLQAETTWGTTLSIVVPICLTFISLGGYFIYLYFKERSQNRDAFIKSVVNQVLEVKMKDIHDLIEKLANRVDELFILLSK